ncbi:hypothetical protein T09_2813 [Trichinella sp. T9]|nr:hypothetical protein T09_2813 [Trichinella sp. T9]
MVLLDASSTPYGFLASRSALIISTCFSCNENSMFAFPVSMSNGAIIQSGTVMLSRSSKRPGLKHLLLLPASVNSKNT